MRRVEALGDDLPVTVPVEEQQSLFPLGAGGSQDGAGLLAGEQLPRQVFSLLGFYQRAVAGNDS